VSTLVAASPELKRLWIRALKRVHRGLAVKEQDKRRDWLTNQGNEANAGSDEVALTAILEPKALPPDVWEALAQAQQSAPPQSTPQPPLGPQHPLSVSGRAAVGILWPAFAVLCLLLSVIFDTLGATVGRYPSLTLLVLLTGAVLWLITRNPRLSYNQKARSMAAVASGMVLVGISLFGNHLRANPLYLSERTATAQALAVNDSGNASHRLGAMNAHAKQSNPAQMKATEMPPRPEPRERLGSLLGGYIEVAKSKVAQKWNPSEVAGSTPAGATVYIQFSIRRRGNHEAPTMETSSGYSSLDVSCLRAVDRVQTFDHLPTSYDGESLTVLYHCTYPGSASAKFAQDSFLPPVQQPPTNGAQQTTTPTTDTN
jgi:hypothetical protein